LPENLFAEDSYHNALQQRVPGKDPVDPVEVDRLGEIVEVVVLVDEKRAVQSQPIGKQEGD
jgi:hypothetical protein